MVTVTGFIGVFSDGISAKVDTHGNNVAFSCPDCLYPVLAVARENQRGFSKRNPAICRCCGEHYVIEPREELQKIVIYKANEL